MQTLCETPQLVALLTEPKVHDPPVNHVHYSSSEYLAIGCDLRDLKTLQAIFDGQGITKSALFFTAEVSLAYMDRESVDALVAWIATLPDGNSTSPEFMRVESRRFVVTYIIYSTLLHTGAISSLWRYPPICTHYAEAFQLSTHASQIDSFISNPCQPSS